MVIDFFREMAWVTFSDDGYETKWYPLMYEDVHQEYDPKYVMNTCNEIYGERKFGVSPTSQMIVKKVIKSNLY